MKMNDKEFDNQVSNSYNACVSLILKEKMDESENVANDMVNTCKLILKDDKCLVEDTKNKALVVGILFRGIQNLINLHTITNSSDWISQPKIAEKAWILLCNFRERIYYASNYIVFDDLSLLIERIKYFENIFMDKYGHGLYVSPEMYIKKLKCNVCGEDFSICEHNARIIYNGILCTGVADKIIPKGVSIVDNPKDYRCRIWPWNTKNSNELESSSTFTVIALTLFRLDDFADEGGYLTITVNNKTLSS